jgi:hypothetical protein
LLGSKIVVLGPARRLGESANANDPTLQAQPRF